MSSKFFTNNNERNLFDKFKGIIEHMKYLYAFHAVVGYFRSSGYFALQPHLQNIKDIKILVGAQPKLSELQTNTSQTFAKPEEPFLPNAPIIMTIFTVLKTVINNKTIQ